ncbi:MAG: PadR family transcriptional regulator [archaeon]
MGEIEVPSRRELLILGILRRGEKSSPQIIKAYNHVRGPGLYRDNLPGVLNALERKGYVASRREVEPAGRGTLNRRYSRLTDKGLETLDMVGGFLLGDLEL